MILSVIQRAKDIYWLHHVERSLTCKDALCELAKLLFRLEGEVKGIKMNEVTIKIQRLPHAPIDFPRYATFGSAAVDFRAGIQGPWEVMPGDICPVPTGLKVGIPEGYSMFLFARSGLSMEGIHLSNGVGVIDSDYREEVKILLKNSSDKIFTIGPNDRIAQGLVLPVPRLHWLEVPDLGPVTSRTGGFGSSGVL